MISTKQVNIRSVNSRDKQFLIKVRNDVELQSLLLSVPRGTSDLNIQEWLDCFKDGDLIYIIALSVSDQAVGYIQIKFTDTNKKIGTLGILIDREYQGKGFGQESISAFKAYLKNILNIKKILIYVDEENKAGLHVYKKVGFREVGTLKNHMLINTRDINVVLMESLL